MDVLIPGKIKVDDLGQEIAGFFAEERNDPGFQEAIKDEESRAVPVSKLERAIIKDSDQCPLCVANNDPRKVPVHPNCHCDVITDSVETGQVSNDHRLLSTVLDRAMDGVEFVGAEEVSAVSLQSETVAVFNPEDMRFADLQKWLEQMAPYLQSANTYVSIVVDEDTDEAAEQVEEIIALAAEDIDTAIEALQTKKFWFAIARAAI